MTVEKLEKKVWAQDGIRIVIRAASDDKVKSYTQKNAAQASWRITQFLEKRITPLLEGQEVIVLQGNGKEPHGGTLLRVIRATYRKD